MEYRYTSISELHRALRDRVVNAKELAENALLLCEQLEPYHALANELGARAIEQATNADKLLENGDFGPLCGIPWAAKDLFAAKGAPTTWGSVEFAARELPYDASVVSTLEEAGAVLVAKLAMSELAGGGRPARPGSSMFGQPRNPWDLSRYSGGSSSGSGIAVALGVVPFALGTETGGSILGPAAFCGVTGFRPTAGSVSTVGTMTLSRTLDKVGPLCRSCEDCAVIMSTIANQNSGPTFSPPGGLAALYDAMKGNLTIGISRSEIEEASPAVRSVLRQALDEMSTLADVVDIEIDRDPRFTRGLEDIVRIEAAHEFRSYLEREDFRMSDDHQLEMLRWGLGVSAMEYLDILWDVRDAAQETFADVFSHVDLLVTASRTDVAPRIDAINQPRDPDKMSELLRAAGNLTGIPGLSIPCGLSDGLPVGLQLVGPSGSDPDLLAIGAAYQRMTSHHTLHPEDIAS